MTIGTDPLALALVGRQSCKFRLKANGKGYEPGGRINTAHHI
jgi:hypothetical protein